MRRNLEGFNNSSCETLTGLDVPSSVTRRDEPGHRHAPEIRSRRNHARLVLHLVDRQHILAASPTGGGRHTDDRPRHAPFFRLEPLHRCGSFCRIKSAAGLLQQHTRIPLAGAIARSEGGDGQATHRRHHLRPSQCQKRQGDLSLQSPRRLQVE